MPTPVKPFQALIQLPQPTPERSGRRGGFDPVVENLRTKWKVQSVAPGHCTGEPAFARLKKAYGDNYVYAGLGTKVELPAPAK